MKVLYEKIFKTKSGKFIALRYLDSGDLECQILWYKHYKRENEKKKKKIIQQKRIKRLDQIPFRIFKAFFLFQHRDLQSIEFDLRFDWIRYSRIRNEKSVSRELGMRKKKIKLLFFSVLFEQRWWLKSNAWLLILLTS